MLCLLAACANDATPIPTATAQPEPSPSPTASIVVTSSEPLPANQAQPPARLVFPTLDLTIEVAPMAWQVTQVAGERSAVWQVPTDQAGWHINSAKAGSAGNVVISGHHLQAAAVFAPLARGELSAGNAILLTDAQGRSFAYQIIEISEPISALASTLDEQARVAEYLAPQSKSLLTLATGWPEFSDTHYIFVVAELVGTLP